MKLQRLHLLPAAALIALAIGAPEAVLAAATERIVYQPSTDSCTSSDVDPLKECYTTIRSALEAAVAADGDYITIKPGTYTETLTLNKNVSIYGTETARAIISGGGSGPIITVSGATSISIRRLTFMTATVGISVMNSSSVTIANNVFRVGSGTAVSVDSSSSANIINNTFYQNYVGISFVTGTGIDIENNIFYGSGTGTTAINSTASASVLQYNCFYNITAGQTGTVGNVTTDPLLVDPAAGDAGDFHLESGSDCIDAGTSSCGSCGSDSVDGTAADIGAYGGPNADKIPFPVSGLAVTASDATTISISWSVNNCYLIGGYNVYYGTTSGTYDNGPLNAGNVTSHVITGLGSATSPTGAPVLSLDTVANNTLVLSWDDSAVSGQTGYEIRYDLTSPPATPIDVENVTSHALGGLTNGTYYYVAVVPYALNTYYIAVKAYYSASPTSFLSDYSNEVSQTIGTKAYGTSSNEIYDYPEAITAYPNLPNKGCFIATAAYGYYSAPQVQALREFRDKYLMTNTPGRAFVGWYYTYGPFAAQFINDHPGLKPVVRVALLPAVGGAMFMTRTSALTKMFALAFIGLMGVGSVWVYPRRKNHRPR